MPKAACTIISNNYLPFARVLARSFLEHHPDSRLYVLFVDRPDPSLDYRSEPFQCLFASELGIPRFRNLAFRYSILELNTAVKPYFLSYLHHEQGLRDVCYFDPDILVSGDLDDLYRIVASADAVLTPHILEPIDDDANPTERDFLLSGIYNLGFLGVSFNPDTLSFLSWWQRRLYTDCRHEVEAGLFVDQKWMDLAPAFLSNTAILRDPGYNVAYWNLVHRYLSLRGGQWWVGGQPLRFFHFSGFDPRHPKVLSKYQDRIDLTKRFDLLPLFELYSRRLESEGYVHLRKLPYAYGRFSNGVPVPPVARAMLWQADARGWRWGDPFDATGPDSYFHWLLSPAELGVPVDLPRIAIGLWNIRDDLQTAFPEPLGRSLRPFARWFADSGASEAGIPDVFVEPLQQVEDLHSVP